MAMPGRAYAAPGSLDDKYRYSHNGQEKDNDIFIGALSAEYWEYDSRTGRRWENDPITYPWQSSYATFNNNPIYFADPAGLEGGPAKLDLGDAGKGGDGETTTKNSDGSSTSTVTWGRGGSCTVYTPGGDEGGSSSRGNTPKGQLTINYSPIKFNQIGGNVRIKPQDDFSYLPPNATGNYGLGQPDEASSIITANLLLKRQTFGGRSSLDYSGGVSFTSLKGGILNNGLDYGDDPHFGSGYRTLGVNAIVDYNLRIIDGFNLFGSANVGGGFSLSDFGENSTTGLVVIPRKGYPGWGTHGVGATGVLHLGFNVTPKLWKSTSRDIIKLNISAVFVVHTIRVSPYTIQTSNGPVDHGVSKATFMGQPRMDATLTIDIFSKH